MIRQQRSLRHLLGLASVGAVLLAAASLAGAAGLWSPAEMVRPNDGYDSIFPNVEVSPDGVVWIVWSTTDPVQGDSETYCVRIENGVQSPREKIHEDNAIMDRCPRMSMGSDGIPWVVWERYRSTLGYIQVVTHWTGAGWAPPDTVFTQGSRWDNYAIHASSSEDVWVVKSSRAAGRVDRDLYLRHWDGRVWGEIEQLGFEGEDDEDPALTTDEEGRAWVAWLRWNNITSAEHKVYAARRDEGGWSAPMRVENRTKNLGVCDIATRPDGRPIVVWQWSAGQTSDLRYAVLADTGWAEGGLVNAPDDPTRDGDGSARLTRTPGGDLWVAWTSYFRRRMLSYIAASRWTGSGWSEEEVVSVPDTTHMYYEGTPDIAVGPDGRAWAVWQRMQNTDPWDTDIYVAHRDVTTPVDVWGLSAAEVGGVVEVTWHASPGVAPLGVHVWRAEGAGCVVGAGIPGGAVRLTSEPIHGCTLCTFTDDAVVPGEVYCYWLEQLGGAVFGPVTASVAPGASDATASAAFPNPFDRTTAISFSVAAPGGRVVVSIHDTSGRLVRRLVDAELPPGAHTLTWDGRGDGGQPVAAGVYFCRVKAGETEHLRTAVMLR